MAKLTRRKQIVILSIVAIFSCSVIFNFYYHEKKHSDKILLKDIEMHKPALANTTSILCWIVTNSKNHRSNANVIKRTWAKRCDKFLFVSDEKDEGLPSIALDYSSDVKMKPAMKLRTVFIHLYEYYLDKYDWYLKADDTSYVIVDNLRKMLSLSNPMEPVYYGPMHTEKEKQRKSDEMAVFAFSNGALKRLGNKNENCFSDKDNNYTIIDCMKRLAISPGYSLDEKGKNRFQIYRSFNDVSLKNMKFVSFSNFKIFDMSFMDNLIYGNA